MGAIWARRSKASTGSSSKRRRTSDPDLDSKQEEPQTAARSPDSKGSREDVDKPPIAHAAKKNDTNVAKAPPKDVDAPVAQTRYDADHHLSLLDADQGAEPQKRKALKAAPHIRSSVAVDFQRDICKQYKLKGFCSYGDSCKFLHEREDSSAGRQTEKDWELVKDRKKVNIEKQPGPEKITGCSSCGLDPPRAAVKPQCDHLICENCFIQDSKETNAKCKLCGTRLGDVAETAH